MNATRTVATTKLLLVDDREENLFALEALLERPDLTLLMARSGREALELLLAHDVALALLDVQMPEMDGFELAELMRGAERTQHVPIIFVTAGTRDGSRVFRGYDTGAVDFLFKPIEPHILRNKVETFVQLDRQRRQLALQLEELSETLRMNETFSAVLGHDLRNPLSAITTTASTLVRASDDPRVRESAQRLQSIATRMSRMIGDLLDLSRARLAGGIPVERKPIDLADVIARTTEELGAAQRDSGVTVECEGDLHGEWDADRLAQLLCNLTTNALQHGAERKVAIRADGRDPKRVRVSVWNSGAIAQELLPQLFDPFRSGVTRAGRAEGLGLGLYIVQQIASAHGGQVDVRSVAAEGTTFTVDLPRS